MFRKWTRDLHRVVNQSTLRWFQINPNQKHHLIIDPSSIYPPQKNSLTFDIGLRGLKANNNLPQTLLKLAIHLYFKASKGGLVTLTGPPTSKTTSLFPPFSDLEAESQRKTQRCMDQHQQHNETASIGTSGDMPLQDLEKTLLRKP